MSTSLDDCDDFIIPRRQKQENDNYLAIITIVTHYAKQYLLNVTVNWNLKYVTEVKADTTEIDWNDP